MRGLSVLDRDHYPENFLDRIEALRRRVAALERPMAPSRVHATHSSGQNIADSAVTTIEYDEEHWDERGEFDDTTYTFTAQVAGYYHVSAQAVLTATDAFTGGEVVYLRLYIETAADVYLDRQDQLDVHGVTTTQVRVGGSADVYLDAGEDLDVRIYQDSGGALALDTDSDLNHLSIHRV